MSYPEIGHFFRAFISILVAIGVYVLTRAITDLPAVKFDYRLPILAMLIIASGRFAIKVPGRAATVGVSEVFVFGTILLFGTSAATMIVALEGIGVALMQRRQPLYRALFNVAEPAVSTWSAGTVFVAVSTMLPQATAFPTVMSLVPMVAMAAVYFLLNSVLTACVLAFESGSSAYAVWGEHALILTVNYYAAASLATLGSTGGQNLSLAVIGMVIPLLALSYVAYREAATRVEEAHQHVDDVEQLYHATVETLAIAVDQKDQVTHGHIRRVQRHTLALARALGVTEHTEVKALEAAALLHDVGKLCVPDHVLNKPGALKDGEYDAMKLHATKGADILSAVKFPYPVVPIVRHHHEYWNGRGYPDGLSGEQIPVGARILAIIDCFDALTSDRPYRRKLRDDEALEMIRERSGTAYDPQMVEQFIKIVPELRRQDGLFVEATQPLTVLSPGAPAVATEGSAASLTAAIARLQIAGGSVLDKVVQILPEGEACLFAVSPTGSMLLPASATKLAQIACEDLAFPVGSGLSGWVAAHRHTIVNSDPSLDFGDRAAQLGFRSATSTPVFAFATVSAVLTVYMPTRGACSDRQARMIGTLAQEVGSELVRREQLLQTRASRSPHTFSAA